MCAGSERAAGRPAHAQTLLHRPPTSGPKSRRIFFRTHGRRPVEAARVRGRRGDRPRARPAGNARLDRFVVLVAMLWRMHSSSHKNGADG